MALDGFSVVAITMDGTDKAYTIPDNVASIALQCLTEDIDLKSASSGASWTLLAGVSHAFATRTVKNKTIYLNGTSGTVVQVMLYLGTMDTRS